MPTNKLLVAVVLLAALSGLVYWSNKRQAAEEAKPAKDAPPKLVTLNDNQVTQVEVDKKGGDDTVLRKDASSKWVIEKPQQWTADQDAVSSVVSAFTGLAWDRLIEDKASDLNQYGLGSPQVRLVVTSKDGKSQTLLLGDDTPTGGSTFAKLENDPRVFAISSGTKGSFDKSAQDLRDKRLLTFNSDKLSRVEVHSKGTTFEIGKNNQNEWQILKPGPFRADSFQVEELVRKLKDAKADLSADKARSWGSSSPVAVIKVTDNSGTQQLDIRKGGADYYAKSSVFEGVQKVANDLGEAAAKGVSDYRNKKLFDFGFDELKRIDLKLENGTYAFQKSGEKWTSNGKEVDSVAVQSLIDKLRALEATDFPTKPMPAATIEMSVATADGKRNEKVRAAKDKDGNYLAQRENEPATYMIAASGITDVQRAAADVKPAVAPAGKK